MPPRSNLILNLKRVRSHVKAISLNWRAKYERKRMFSEQIRGRSVRINSQFGRDLRKGARIDRRLTLKVFAEIISSCRRVRLLLFKLSQLVIH